MDCAIVLIRNSSWVAKLIRLFMMIWFAVRLRRPSKIYHHCEIKFGQLSSGAIETGVKTRVFTTYINSDRTMDFKIYNLNLTESEWNKGRDYLTLAENTPYEYIGLWFQIVKIFSNKWSGDRSKKQLYCFEHAARFLNATGKYCIDDYLNPVEFKDWCDNNL